MIPETGLLNQQCDEFSGIVERDKRQYWWVYFFKKNLQGKVY